MAVTKDIKHETMMAARENGINTVMFRNAMGRKLGLNITESDCLSFLGIKGTATPTEISHYTGLTTGSTTTMLDRLEKKNFIRRKANPNDRRGILVEINEEYAAVAFPLVSGIQKAHRDLIDSYTDAELETITSFLTGFAKNLAEHTQKIDSGKV